MRDKRTRTHAHTHSHRLANIWYGTSIKMRPALHWLSKNNCIYSRHWHSRFSFNSESANETTKPSRAETSLCVFSHLLRHIFALVHAPRFTSFCVVIIFIYVAKIEVFLFCSVRFCGCGFMSCSSNELRQHRNVDSNNIVILVPFAFILFDFFLSGALSLSLSLPVSSCINFYALRSSGQEILALMAIWNAWIRIMFGSSHFILWTHLDPLRSSVCGLCVGVLWK